MIGFKEMQQAKKRVRRKKEFYFHLSTYLIIIAFLFAINKLTTPGFDWYLFPMLSWGVAIALHYVGVFGIPGHNLLSPEWEEKELEKEIENIERAKSNKIDEEDRLELKEVRKMYRDSDLV